MARKAKKRRYSRSSGSDVESEMRRYKKGTAKSEYEVVPIPPENEAQYREYNEQFT